MKQGRRGGASNKTDRRGFTGFGAMLLALALAAPLALVFPKGHARRIGIGVLAAFFLLAGAGGFL
ncbi:MAG: hypothetical protein ACLS68_07785 [Acutalibacteraceae bacterium]|nr:hypothetical protein [Clostridiales bacterium]